MFIQSYFWRAKIQFFQTVNCFPKLSIFAAQKMLHFKKKYYKQKRKDNEKID